MDQHLRTGREEAGEGRGKMLAARQAPERGETPEGRMSKVSGVTRSRAGQALVAPHR